MIRNIMKLENCIDDTHKNNEYIRREFIKSYIEEVSSVIVGPDYIHLFDDKFAHYDNLEDTHKEKFYDG